MNNNFLVGIEAIRPVCIKSVVGEDPEFIWIATHKDYDWFCGMGRNSISAINHLEGLIAVIEENDQRKKMNRSGEFYKTVQAQLQEDE